MKAPCLLAILVLGLAGAPAEAKGKKNKAPVPEAGRYRIYQSTTGVEYGGKPDNRAENTVLLDTVTGQTWLLWPTADTPSGYSWIEFARRVAPPKE